MAVFFARGAATLSTEACPWALTAFAPGRASAPTMMRRKQAKTVRERTRATLMFLVMGGFLSGLHDNGPQAATSSCP